MRGAVAAPAGARPARHVLAAVFAAVALVVGLGLAAPPAAADLKDDLLRRQREYAAERERVSASLEGTNVELAQTYLALQDINARLPIAQAELEEAILTLKTKQREAEAIAARLVVAEQQQATLAAQIASSEAEEARIRVAIGQLARSAYRDGVDLSALSVVLEATSPEEFAARFSVMDVARRTQTQALTDLATTIAVSRNMQARLDAVQERIVELKAEADAAVVAAEKARKEAADRKAEIERLKREAEERAADLERRKRQYESQRASIDSANRAVANQIAAIAAAEAAARARQSGTLFSPGLIGPPIAGSLHVTSPYGYRVYPITGGWFMHNGVDFRSGCGERQYAAAAGTVVKIGYAASNGTHGNQVIINHGVLGGRSTVTVYNHLSSFAVGYGQRVSKGQVIGYTGATGATTGCHVHFELWFNGSTVDPMGYL